MTKLADIAPFPNPGVRLVEEDDAICVWEEVFEPGIATPPHRHTHDYIAMFPEGGELTLTHVAGGLEDYTFLNGSAEELPSDGDKMRFQFSAGTVVRSHVPPKGTAHIALNEGSTPLRMILIEIKNAKAD